MKYFEHPLNNFSKEKDYSEQSSLDSTPIFYEAEIFPSFKKRIKTYLGRNVYPFINKVQHKQNFKRFNLENEFERGIRLPEISTRGQKGSGIDIFYSTLKKEIDKKQTVLHFGCGLGYELILTAKYLRPKLIVGCDYFNYKKAWTTVIDYIKRKYGCEVKFFQVDLRDEIPIEIPKADLLLSFAVLEHLKELDVSLEKISHFLKPDGQFASIWGPMWYSYSGDHIAGELGLEHGFDHILLGAVDYFEFYKGHPRNRETYKKGGKGWLELGLTNFALYSEYMNSLQKIFGSTKYLLWTLSEEALEFKKLCPEKWKKALSLNPHITEMDLVLSCVSIII
jgi:SAM-dependent methyltransferase